MSPFARLIAAAEVNLAAASRRAVESAAAPIKEKSREIVSDALGTVTATARNVAIKAAFGAFAVVMLIVGIVLALMAAYGKLETILGPVEALLVMAGAFVLLAVVGVVGAMLVPTRPKRAKPAPTPPPVQVDLSDATARVADQTVGSYARLGQAGEPGTTEHALDSGLDALVSALGEAGFKREQAGLRAGLAIARQLRPMQVASLALLGGFVMGARLLGRRRR